MTFSRKKIATFKYEFGFFEAEQKPHLEKKAHFVEVAGAVSRKRSYNQRCLFSSQQMRHLEKKTHFVEGAEAVSKKEELQPKMPFFDSTVAFI